MRRHPNLRRSLLNGGLPAALYFVWAPFAGTWGWLVLAAVVAVATLVDYGSDRAATLGSQRTAGPWPRRRPASRALLIGTFGGFFCGLAYGASVDAWGLGLTVGTIGGAVFGKAVEMLFGNCQSRLT